MYCIKLVLKKIVIFNIDNITLKSHLAFMYNIGRYRHYCDVEGCNYICMGLSQNNTRGLN